MFIELSDKIDNDLIINSLEEIQKDYRWCIDNDFWFDYTHNIDLVDPNPDLLTRNGEFWTVVPLILAGEVLDFIPERLQNSHTVKTLMGMDAKPVIAIFSMLEPNSDIDPHIDTDDEVVMGTKDIPWNERESSIVKYHMGVDVHNDGDARMVVGDASEKVSEGKLVAFDETITHYAYNHTSKKRGVLIISYLKHELYGSPKDK